MDHPKYNAQKFLDPSVTVEETVKLYSKMAREYDDLVCSTVYNGPEITAETVSQIFKETIDKDNIRIVDLACGTGLVTRGLKSRGFTNIDGVDPSEGMLEVSKERGLYINTHCCLVGDENSLPIPDNTYDASVVCGGMGPNMIPCNGLREMIRIVKPGGYVVNVFREEIMTIYEEYIGRLKPLMEQLLEEGKWREISCTQVDYALDKPGLVYIHQVL